MAEVIPILGGSIPGQPHDDVVETLEMLLERARAGELIGLAHGTVAADGSQGTGWDGAAGTRHTLGTAIMILNHRYAESLREG